MNRTAPHQSSTDLLTDLNEPQRSAVTHESGPLLIFAGAGSGKTRTLTHRIAYLISHHGVPPSRILAVTFTNKAAREMRSRLDALVGTAAQRLWMGTFHALCARMLRIHGERIGIDPRFVIFDSDDSGRVMKDILKEADVDSSRYPPSRMLGRVSDAKNHMRTPEQVGSTAASPNDRVLARIYERYQQRLTAAHALDFDDLLVQAVRLLKESPETLEYWSERFLHILVDEFQDVNSAQFQWAQLLAHKHRNICVVGDDDQSIYAWRGANVEIILDFESRYPDATVVRLEQNYRSTQNILDAAHGVISRNVARKAKRLWTELSGGAPVAVHGAATADDEARWVLRQMELLRRERQGDWSDFAILCRVNAQSRAFEEAFMRARVPLRLIGTQRFYDRKEIKDLIAYLKIIYNVHDAVALTRVINVPPRGIGAATVTRLQALATESGRSLGEVLLDEEAAAVLGKAAQEKLREVRRLVLDLRQDATETDSVALLLETVIDRTRYTEYLRQEHTVDGVDRLANVDEFLTVAAAFDERTQAEQAAPAATGDDARFEEIVGGPLANLGQFLETVALADNAGDKADSAARDAVSLMTMHSAKGLEFPVVFLVGLEQGLLPHARALWGEQPGPDQLEEERRLCYVALTRAREQVFLTYAAQRTLHGRTENTVPSQFLEEIPEELLKRSGLATYNAPRARHSATDWSGGSSFTPRRTATSSGASALEPRGSAAPRQPSKFNIGDRLRHPTFGEGLVVNASPSGGPGEWVEVAFLQADVGKKKLIVAYAPLQKV